MAHQGEPMVAGCENIAQHFVGWGVGRTGSPRSWH